MKPEPRPRSANPMRPLPFLKWAGGKRWFVAKYSHLLPIAFRTYIEPFLGSGAVYFALMPRRATLADSNEDLINTYRTIRKCWMAVVEVLKRHQALHNTAYYYHIRNAEPSDPVERAARFIYLNRTCWNGLYRVNAKGQFNVPLGTKTLVLMPTDDFGLISKILQRASLRNGDFESIIDKADRGDFLFVDPPYTINHNLNGFRKYNQYIFRWEDQVRLHAATRRAKNRGTLVMITNANHPSIRELYSDIGSFTLLSRHSVLAANSDYRRLSSELLIRSWG
jgi:DNA adenine methylase